jgi:hypothetical protein
MKLQRKNMPDRKQYFVQYLSLMLIAMATILSPLALQAQTTASLTGTVLDSSGAIIPNAHITLTEESSLDNRELASNASGFFNFAGIKPGTYTVTVSATGFQTLVQKGLVVNPGDIRNLSALTLTVGTSTQQVTVESAIGEVATVASGERSALLSTKDIQRLTIQSRNISELLKILPGVTTTANGVGNGTGFNFNDASSSGSAIGVGLSTNGAPYRGGTAYLLDGASIIDPGCACWSIATVNPDMTQEVKVQTSNFGADAPQGPIVVNAISRSGTSSFHGQAYLYARNGVFNSNTWQNNNAAVKRPEDAYYYPGGSIGGPVLIPGTSFNRSRKLLFWAGYEYFWQNLGSSAPLQSYVPTAAMRAGNFSATDADNAKLCAASGGINSSRTDFCNNLTGTVAPNGAEITGTQIPSAYLDPGALSLLKLFPQPNLDPTTNASGYNYYSATSAQHNGYIYRVRGDYNISDRDKVYVSFQHGHDVGVSFAHIYYTPSYSIAYPGGNLLSPVNSNVISGSWIHIFNSVMTNEVRISSGRLTNPFTVTNPNALATSTLGYPYGTIYSSASKMVPSINSPGARTLPDISQPDIFQQDGTYNTIKSSPSVTDDFSFVYKNHSFKIGGYWARAGNKQGTYGFPNGSLSYASGLKTDAVSGRNIGSVNPLANFLMGVTSGFSQANINPVTDMYYTTAAGYVQDNWKITQRLMLNLGLRLDHVGRWQDRSGVGLAVWRPDRYASEVGSKLYPGVSWHAIDVTLPNGGSPVQAVFLEPRLGFAYDLHGNGKTVVRGGWAIYRWNDQFNDYAGPLGTSQGIKSYNSPSGQAITLAEISALGQNSSNLGSASSSVYATSQTDDQVGNTYAYNLTISQQTPFNSLLEVAYVGNNSTNLLMGGQSGSSGIGGSNFVNQNKIPLGGLFKPDPVTGAPAPADPENVANIVDYYPYRAGYGTNSITVGSHVGYSNYNGVQVSWLKRSGRLSYNLNYTYSKALGIVNSTVDAFTVHGNYGVLNIDRPHVVNTSYAFDLGTPIHGNKLAEGAVNGWTISGTTTWQAGGNLQANSSQNLGLTINNTTLNHTIGSSTYFGTPVQSVLPILTCNPTSKLKQNQKLNMDCFSAPPVGTQGIRQAPYLSGASFFNADIGIYKTFHINERNSLQFRAQAFNWLNHPLPGFSSSDPITVKLQTANNTTFTSQVSNANRGFTDTKFGQRSLQFALKYNF